MLGNNLIVIEFTTFCDIFFFVSLFSKTYHPAWVIYYQSHPSRTAAIFILRNLWKSGVSYISQMYKSERERYSATGGRNDLFLGRNFANMLGELPLCTLWNNRSSLNYIIFGTDLLVFIRSFAFHSSVSFKFLFSLFIFIVDALLRNDSIHEN